MSDSLIGLALEGKTVKIEKGDRMILDNPNRGPIYHIWFERAGKRLVFRNMASRYEFLPVTTHEPQELALLVANILGFAIMLDTRAEIENTYTFMETGA